MTQLTSPLHTATIGGQPVAFGSIVSEGAGTTGVPKIWRAANVSGDYGDARVALYDASGNALLIASAIASGRGLAVTPFGATGTTPLLPNAAALADGAAVPTTTVVGAAMRGYNGASMDGVRTGVGGEPTTAGALRAVVVGNDGYSFKSASSATDGDGGFRVLPVGGMRFNGASWDPERANTQATLLASAARTTSTSTATQTNHDARGVWLTLAISANPGGAETLTVYVMKQTTIGGTVDQAMVRFPAIAAATSATYRYLIYPGALETVAQANQEVTGLALPRTWAAYVEHSAAGSWTYALTAELVL